MSLLARSQVLPSPSQAQSTGRCTTHRQMRLVCRSIPVGQRRVCCEAQPLRRDVLLALTAANIGAAFLASPLIGSAQAVSSPFRQGPKDIVVTKDVTTDMLKTLDVTSWQVWSSEIAEFPYTYGHDEDCYFVKGRVTVTPDGGRPVEIAAGDFVTFPAGMSCTWVIKEPVKKYYKEYTEKPEFDDPCMHMEC